MPRPISWLPRLHQIRQTVSSSVRSHYDRHDLEQLFELQPRAAQNLLQLLPTVQVGTSRLVERETLGAFLDRVRDADDTQALFDQIRLETAEAQSRLSRRVLRTLVRRDADPLSVDELPASIQLNPGHLEIRFDSLLELAEGLYALARVIESPEFAQAAEPIPAAVSKPTEFHSMLATLRTQ